MTTLEKPNTDLVQYNPATHTYDTPDGTHVAAELVDNAQCLLDVFNIALIRDRQRNEASK